MSRAPGGRRELRGASGPVTRRGTFAARTGGILVLVSLAVGLSAGVLTGRIGSDEPFPHEIHSGLFPVCAGCHLGVRTGDATAFYPDPRSCRSCHDGERADEVEWTAPSPEPDNLRFDHREHAELMADDYEAIGCGDCHRRTDAEVQMAVVRAGPERCMSCHAHQAEIHLADAECEACHVPLAETGFSADRIERLPRPPSHESSRFLESLHGEESATDIASCTTCHTRERCTSCHVDASRQERIAAIPRAAEAMRLPAAEARYPLPESHRRSTFLEQHGAGIQPEECSTCHARESCTSCHTSDPPESVVALVSRDEVPAPGVGDLRRPPESHATTSFAEDHGTVAATGEAFCTTCHARESCTGCHQAAATGVSFEAFGPTSDRAVRDDSGGPRDGSGRSDAGPGAGFHPPNYALRHAPDAFGQTLECSNCHDATRFCQDCHRQQGLGARGRLGSSFHDAQPLWIFRHGQAARQTLESCASCHRQRDCLQCHSQLGRFRVSPHGREFDAERVFERNPQICFACHLSNPLNGRQP